MMYADLYDRGMVLEAEELEELTALRKQLLERFPDKVLSRFGNGNMLTGMNKEVRNAIRSLYTQNHLERLRVCSAVLTEASYSALSNILAACRAVERAGLVPSECITKEYMEAREQISHESRNMSIVDKLFLLTVHDLSRLPLIIDCLKNRHMTDAAVITELVEQEQGNNPLHQGTI